MSRELPETYIQLPVDGCRRKACRSRIGKVSPLLLLTALTSFFCGYIVLPGVSALLLSQDSAFVSMSAAAGPILSIIMLLAITRYHSGSFRKTMLILGFRRFPVKTLLAGLFIAIAIMIAGGTVTMLWGFIADFFNWDLGTPPTVKAAMSENPWDVAALLVTALIAAPVFEEIFFRRVLFGSLKQFLPLFSAVALASLAFSAMHLSPLQLPGLLMIGWVWQIFYIRSQTLWTSVILHFFNNLLAAVMLMMVRFTEFQAF